jgi:hypothetical protein
MKEFAVVLSQTDYKKEWQSAVDVLASMVAVGYALKGNAIGEGVEPVNDAIDSVQEQLDDLRKMIIEEGELYAE